MATYNMKTFEKKIKKWGKNQDKAIRRALIAGAQIVQKEVIHEHLSGPRMAKGDGGDKHATLARVSGDLAKINTKVSARGPRMSATIGSSMSYAKNHEFGIGVPKRPFLQPSLEKKRSEAVDLISKKIMEEYKKS